MSNQYVEYIPSRIYGLIAVPRSITPSLSDDDDFPHIFAGEFSPKAEVSLDNYELVKNIVSDFKNLKNILEIGVNRPENGQLSFTNAFLGYKPKESVYLGIDILDKSYLDNKEQNISTIKTDSLKQEEVRGKMKEIGMDSISILMIDGWHSINAVINDWRYADLLTNDGVVIFHDTNFHPGPRFFLEGIDKSIFKVDKYCESRYDWGVSVARKI